MSSRTINLRWSNLLSFLTNWPWNIRSPIYGWWKGLSTIWSDSNIMSNNLILQNLRSIILRPLIISWVKLRIIYSYWSSLITLLIRLIPSNIILRTIWFRSSLRIQKCMNMEFNIWCNISYRRRLIEDPWIYHRGNMWYFTRGMHNWYLTYYPHWPSFSNCSFSWKSKKLIDIQGI